MKTKTLIAAMLLATVAAGADPVTSRQRIVLATNTPVVLTASATNDLNSALQRGLFEEEGNRDYAAAIASYQSLVAQFDQNRQLAATAIFRLGECYRKLGRTNEAVAQYERILNEFPNQTTLNTLSRQNLAGIGLQPAPTASRAQQQLKELLAKQITLAEQDLADTQKLFQMGKATQGEIRAAEREVLRLRQQVAALDSNKAELLDLSPPATSEEDQEIARLQKMIQDSPDLLNAPGEGGLTPISRAASGGWLRVAGFLLDHGAVLDSSALSFATQSGNKAMVEFLIARGANLEARDGTGGTALHSAAEKGYLAVAEILIQHGANLEARNSKQNGEQTPLHRAATRGNAAMAALLMAKGADVNARDAKGVTAIGRAVQSAQLGVLNKLLAAGAQPDVEDEAGMTALSYAAAGGNVETVKALLAAKANPNAGKNNSTLFAAAGQAQLEVLKLLLSAGAKPNAKGYAGGTPLLFAIQSGHYESAAVLIQNGADANLTNDIGMTPLHMAVWAQNIPTISLLLSNRADINAPHPSGRTALGMSKEAEGGSRPFRPGDYGGQGLAPDQALARKISALLREHDALDNLPDFKTIRITRAGGGQPFVVFQKDISSVNRFTLLEVIRNFYRNAIDNREKPFPDFSRIIIQRPVFGQSGKRREITINLLTESNSFDCAKDQWLEFGDVVEIPEREHTLAEQAVGITEEQSKDLSHCLEGKVTFVVRGQKSELKLDGSAYTGWLQLSLDRVQTLLRSSSDLSHIKILRTDPATKAKQEIMADSKARQSDNVWLRDGDVIEVPDK